MLIIEKKNFFAQHLPHISSITHFTTEIENTCATLN